MAVGHGVLTPVDPQELAARPQVNGHAASPEDEFNLFVELALDAFNQEARLRRRCTQEVFLADSICVAALLDMALLTGYGQSRNQAQ
jgi:hypothetical protein